MNGLGWGDLLLGRSKGRSCFRDEVRSQSALDERITQIYMDSWSCEMLKSREQMKKALMLKIVSKLPCYIFSVGPREGGALLQPHHTTFCSSLALYVKDLGNVAVAVPPKARGHFPTCLLNQNFKPFSSWMAKKNR